MVAKSRSASDKHWFHGKSEAAKKAYLKKHPTSVYAKQARGSTKDLEKAKHIEKHLHKTLRDKHAKLESALEDHRKAHKAKNADLSYPKLKDIEVEHQRDRVRKLHDEVKKAARVLKMHRKRTGVKGEKLKIHSEKRLNSKLKMHEKLGTQHGRNEDRKLEKQLKGIFG